MTPKTSSTAHRLRGKAKPSRAPGCVNRRDFLRATLAASSCAWWSRSLPALPGELDGFRGIFPIMQTPYTEAGAVDFGTLAKEATFLDRAGAHGMVWPQLASEYTELTFDERIEGAETIVRAAKQLRPKVVIGVQAADEETAVRYARHAAKIEPDAIIALPARTPEQQEFDLGQVASYYQAIARACGLPLFIQSMGNMSVEFLLRLARDIPTLRFIKDEAGHTLSRITEFRGHTADKIPAVFTGGHGRTLIDEMARGSAGSMPAASWVDLYVRVWDLWQEGRRGEALDMFSKVLLLVTQASAYGLPSLNYILHLRGVFPNWKVRTKTALRLDDEAMKSLRETLEFVHPYLTVHQASPGG